LLEETIRPATAADQDQYRAWIKELDHDDFQVRERASAGLSNAGELAEPVLRGALAGPISLETKTRVNALLERMPATPPGSAWLATLRALETLEGTGTPEARKLVEQLGKGQAESPQTREAGQSRERMKKRLTDVKTCRDPRE
jgi:hypothetical protein